MAVCIAGTGSYLPERVLTNAELAKMVDTSDEWITTRTGIKERRIAAESEAASDMGAAAANNAINSAGLDAEQIDLIVTATATPDMPFPSTACIVQDLIGARNAFCFDLEAACAGFLYALETGRALIEQGSVQTALIIGTEKFSSITNWTDRNTCILFGDGAGAVVIKPSETGRGIISTCLRSDGSLGGLLTVPGGGSRRPASEQMLAEKSQFVRMDGREVFKHAVRLMSDVAKEALEKADLTLDDVDWIVPHQANMRIIRAIASRLGVPIEKFYVNLERVGNISAASVPVALDEAVARGAIKKGDIVVSTVLGAGFAWGASVLEW